MNLILFKSIAALLVFIASLVAVIYPLKKKCAHHHLHDHAHAEAAESLELGEVFASGIFLGAAFFHMLPDATRMFNRLYGNEIYPLPELICIAGFLLFLFLERLSLATSRLQSQQSIPYILTAILIIHALVEGAALGIGQTLPETFMLFIAIFAHKGSESFSLCVSMLKHQIPIRRIMLMLVFFSLMTPLGIGFGNELNHLPNQQIIAGSFNAFAAGTFLYMSTLHHIHFHKHAKEIEGLIGFGCLLLGVSMMALIALWV